jgi:hypothetical protein
MNEILFDYKLNPTTWAYLSALLTIGIYFKFRRFWSVRNLDLIGLIFFSPGLLLVFHGLAKSDPHLVRMGYVWMFSVGGFFVVRLFLDPLMVRRPLLEPNLSAGGLTFTGISILIFLGANLFAREPLPSDTDAKPLRLETALARQDGPALQRPGMEYFYFLASFSNTAWGEPVDTQAPWTYPRATVQATVARTAAILGHLAIVLGMILIGFRHFDNFHAGVAAASLYLLLPYAGQMTGRIDHVVPGALLVWAIAAYRRPLFAGMFLGIASGLIFYPLFLLPLWISFYWRRGIVRFLVGFSFALAAMVLVAFFLAPDMHAFWGQLRQMFGFTMLSNEGLAGFWKYAGAAYRIPVFAAFAVLAGSLGVWPAHKNLGTLLSCSATVMLGAQFWHGHEGGLYLGWYLPLLVLTILRPNLEDRVALSAVIEGRTTWVARLFMRRRKPAAV